MKKLVAAIACAAVIGLITIAGLAIRTQDDAPASAETKSFFDYSAATDNIEPAGAPIPVTPKLLEHGKWVFRGMCIGCHGAKGDGNGAVWELADEYAPEHKLPRKPRDFTQAVFKIRSTPSGSFPTDVDLFKSISRGLVADQDMPAFKYLPERDRWAVIAYIKSLSDLWEEEAEYQEAPITIGEPSLPDLSVIAAGKEVYAKMQCAKCHGELGKGDGPSAPELEDDSGLPIVPRDFSDASQFVGASDPKGVFQTFNTGLDGTPMPSFLDFLDAEQSWQLVWYVMSLRADFDLVGTRREMLTARGEDVALAEQIEPPAATARPAAVEQVEEPTSADSESETSEAEPDQQTETSETSEASEDASESSDQAVASEQSTDEQSSESSSETAEAAETPVLLGDYKEVAVADGGSVQGKVVYNGSIKKRTVLPTKDKKVCGKSRKEPWVIVGEGGAVAESVIYLKGVAEGKPWPEDMTVKAAQLDQEGCRFHPHVQVARQGSLEIINSDPVLHNTHGYYGTRTAFNIALPEKDQKVTKLLKRPGTVKVDCDAHGWMLGWVQVVENPYFALTAEDGVFDISDIPPGDYTLVVWQEWLGEVERPVTIVSGETVNLDVELER